MARQITITDNLSTIQITYVQTGTAGAGSGTENILKSQIANITMIDTDTVCIIFASQYRKPFIKLNWNEVTAPVVVSGSDLYAQLLVILLNVPSSGVFALSSTFTNADLVAGVLSRTHPYATNNIVVSIYDPTGISVFPTLTVVTPITSPASFTLDFGGAIGAGTYTYVLVANP